MTTRTVAEWDAVIADLQEKRAAAARDLSDLETRAQGLHLPAATGDAKAAAQVAKLEEQMAAAARRVRGLDAALQDAAAQRTAEVAAQAKAERAANLQRARAIKADILRVDREKIAAGLALLVEGFAERDALVLALRPLGHLDNSRHRMLRNQTMMVGALRKAGLHQFVPLDPVAVSHQQSVEAWDGKLLAALDPPAADAEAA